jgi:hypothetical protein
VVLPLQPSADSGIIDSFTVVLAWLEIDGNGGKVVYTNNDTLPVVLDSGTTLTYLPDDVANAVAATVGAQTMDQYGIVVPCALASTQGVFKFRLGNAQGPVISAKISQFVIPFLADPPKFENGQIGCQWGINPAGNNPTIFGDTFLRSAYIVYNLENQSVAIAETNFNASGTRVEQITAANSIPGATSTAM